MNKFSVNQELFSRIFWVGLTKNSDFIISANKELLLLESCQLDKLRVSAEYDTGSISGGTFFSLIKLTAYFKPSVIVEVGTFIGRSTFAMAKAADLSGYLANLYTCDYSNNIDLNLAVNSNITQFKKTSSTVMLTKLANANLKADFVHYDGRIQDADISLLKAISHPETIYLFDDFEGIEKGVMNYVTLKKNNFFQQHILIYPDDSYANTEFGSSKMAVAIPLKLIRFTPQ